MNRLSPGSTDPEWVGEHAWIVASLGGLVVGILVGLAVSAQTSSVFDGVVGGAGFGLVLFIGTGIWGSVLKRRRLQPRDEGLGQWTRMHPSLSAGLIAALVGLLFLVSGLLRDVEPWIALLLGTVAAAVVFLSRRSREAARARRARLRGTPPNHR